MKTTKNLMLRFILLAAIAAVSGVQAVAAPLTPGNLVIYRVGDGSAALTSAATAVFVDEYTPAGVLVQSFAMPTTASGLQLALTDSGTASSAGMLNLSTDQKYITLTGYNATLGTVGVASTTSAAAARVIGRLNAAGTIDTSTSTTAFSGNNIRSAFSTNGTDIWTVGGLDGVQEQSFGTSASSQVSGTFTNLRTVDAFGGQLYVGSGAGAVRLGAVGSGTPTSGPQTTTSLPGLPTSGSPSFYQFFFADLDAGVAGVDTLYVSADDATALRKFSLVGGTWTSNGSVGIDTDDYRGLTGAVSSSTVTLYATRKGGTGAAGGGELVSLVDSSGYNGAFVGTPTLLATAGANTAFRGVDFAPVPEPSSFVLCGLGAIGLLLARRRRKA